MKKIFKNLLALFVTGTMLAGVGCKDYDDDINKINDRLDELTTGKIADIESQISSMQTTIQNLQALETRIKALEDAQVTDADLQKLQDAIDAIEANYVTKDYLTTTLGSYATTQYVGEAIKAVTDALGSFTTDEAIQAAIDAAKQSAIEAAGKACEEAFKTAVESVIAGATEEPTSEIGKAFKEYDAHIKQLLTDAVEKEDGFINQAIAEQIKAAVDAMSAKLSGRLTSLQVIPDLYVNGIETIELKSFAYKAWKVDTEKEEATQGKDVTTTAQTSTAVRYLVSPTTVTTEDIEEPSFVFEKAETRSAVAEQLLNVDSYSVKDGVLTVNVKKASGTEITLANGYIYTAALGVPIAEKWLTDANKPEVVYSDFVALAETTVEPKIAALDADGKYECAYTRSHSHYYGTYKEAQDTTAVKQVAYDDKLDLLTLVTGCYVDAEDNRHEITKDELKAAGLEFRFALPTKPFVKGDNETDQQQFATIAGSTMTSKLPDGTTNNQAAIDKTPVVRVELVDVNNKDAVVDVRYFKIQWVRKTIAPIDLGVIYTFEYTLGCNEFQGKFLWNQMVNEVLAKIGETGMSQDEFLATYEGAKITITSKDHTVGAVKKDGEAGADTAEFVYNFDDPVDESAAAFTWRLTIEQVGNVIDKLVAGDEVKYVVNVTIPAQNSYQGSVNFAFEVKVALPELPEIYGYDSAFWFTDYTLAYVYPIQYNTPGALATCAYSYELDRLFADSKVVKNMLECGKWDIQFAKTQPANGYASGAVTVPSADAAGHSLVKGMNTAVQLNYAAGTPWYAGVQAAYKKTYESAVSDIQVQVINNAEGIGILGQQATLDVWAQLNKVNNYKVATFNVYFVKPLNINSELKDAYFVDQVISGSTIDCSKAFTMTDFKKYIVAKKASGTSELEKYAADLYEYYDVKAPVWDLANAKTNLKQENGNYVVDETITAETAKILAEDRFGVDCITANADNSTLTFKNVKGVKVEKAVKLFIPVTVKHKWGTLTEPVTVDLLPEAPAAE